MPNHSTVDKAPLRLARQCVQGFDADLLARRRPERGQCAAMKLLRRTTIAALMTLAVACGRHAPEPENRQGAVEPAHSADLPPAAFLEPAHAHDMAGPGAQASPNAASSGHIVWTDPSGWVRAPQSSPMRLATYRVPRAAGDADDAELAIFHFGGGQGGDVEANLSRWEKQFSDTKPGDTKRTERTVNGLKAHVLEIDQGTYTGMAMMPGQSTAAKTSYAMLAAVVETPSGSYFVKLTGPSKTVKAQQIHYFEMLDSVRAEK
jgi:hypothetical protein